MSVNMKWTGVKEIDRVMNRLPGQLQDKVLQDAHAQSLKITIERAKLLAPEGPTGNLIDSLGVVRARGKSRTELGLVMGGPRRGKGSHGHLAEYGTKRRKNKKGANRGVMPSKPFMDPAWLQTKSQVLGSISVNIARKLNNFMRRTLRK